MECDGTYDIGISAENKFQLTHSRGVRHRVEKAAEDAINFNSRTHVECDERLLESGKLKQNFNSRTHVECDNKFFV